MAGREDPVFPATALFFSRVNLGRRIQIQIFDSISFNEYSLYINNIYIAQ